MVLLFIPTAWEVWNDRNGETAKDKVRDLLVTVLLYVAIALTLWLDNVNPLKSIALMLGIRVMFFDYVVQYVLVKRGVIHGHWFYYQGKTAKWDRVISKLNPWLVLSLKVLFFVGTIFVYFMSWTF